MAMVPANTTMGPESHRYLKRSKVPIEGPPIQVEDRIKALESCLDPREEYYSQFLQQHTNIKALIAWYHKGELGVDDDVFVVEGRKATVIECLDSKQPYWHEHANGQHHQLAYIGNYITLPPPATTTLRNGTVCESSVPYPRPQITVQDRIKSFQHILDPDTDGYELSLNQHVNIKALINLYQNGEISIDGHYWLVEGRLIPYEECRRYSLRPIWHEHGSEFLYEHVSYRRG